MEATRNSDVCIRVPPQEIKVVLAYHESIQIDWISGGTIIADNRHHSGRTRESYVL